MSLQSAEGECGRQHQAAMSACCMLLVGSHSSDCAHGHLWASPGRAGWLFGKPQGTFRSPPLPCVASARVRVTSENRSHLLLEGTGQMGKGRLFSGPGATDPSDNWASGPVVVKALTRVPPLKKPLVLPSTPAGDG